jgi:uncharacterized protein YeaO (DUF488 family)
MKKMYKVYTSYFSNKLFKKKKHDCIKIPICATLQNYTLYPSNRWYRELAPDVEILNRYNKIGNKTKSIKNWFTREYYRKLDSMKESGDLLGYVKELQNLCKYNDVFLLCYEKPNEFCHRHLLAEYLNKFYELDVSEY